ncbi:MAG: hypothetical protein ABIT47_04210 [Candidatus Paceibacterota bacterium]
MAKTITQARTRWSTDPTVYAFAKTHDWARMHANRVDIHFHRACVAFFLLIVFIALTIAAYLIQSQIDSLESIVLGTVIGTLAMYFSHHLRKALYHDKRVAHYAKRQM